MIISGIVYAIMGKSEIQILKEQSAQQKQELTSLQEVVDFYQCKSEETLKVKSTTNDHKKASPTKSKKSKTHKSRGEYSLMGFSIASDVDEWLNAKLYSALSKYEGPKVLITSMRRSKAR